MIENTPRCRLCGYQLKASHGCDVCTPLKRVLVWPAVSEEGSELSASSVIGLSLRALKARLKRLKTEITREGTNYDSRLTRDLTSLGRTLKELAAEQRKLEDREEARFDELGIEGRIELYVTEFFAQLPEEWQVKLLEGMKQCYSSQNASLLPESTSDE